MPPVRVVSREAEHATRLVRATLAQHRRQEALLRGDSRPQGRLRLLPESGASAEVRRQSTLLRVSSVLEAFVAAEMIRRLEPHAPPPRTTILDDIYTRAEDAAIGSWPKMIDHYARWYKIKLKSWPNWRQVEAMNNARNVVAHGLGDLTRRLARKDIDQLRRDFATIDVVVLGSSIKVAETALRTCGTTTVDFITWLDTQLATYDATP